MSDAPGTSSTGAEKTPPEGAPKEEPLPQWLTEDFLQQALASDPEGARASLRVKGFHAEPAVGKGDNYASVMLRVRVDLEGDGDGSAVTQRNLIVKSMPTSAMARAWVERARLFPKEQRMYKETLPRMHELLQLRLGCRPFGRLAPIHYVSKQDNVMVFEDLCVQGFKMAKRQSGLDMEHCLMVMNAMGTFHALSVAMQKEDPNSVKYEESMYTEQSRPDFEIFIPRSFESLAKIVASWPGFESYADKLRNFGKTILSVTMNMLAGGEERFKVLNHGDCWVNNMLFKYSDTSGQPTDIRLLDFQITRHASMAFDLHYFLFSSPKPEIRTERMEEMLNAYHTTFCRVLRELVCEQRLVSREDLQAEMKRTMPFALLSATGLLPVVVAEPSEALDFEGATEEEVRSGKKNIVQKAMEGKTFANALRLLLPYFEQQGVL